MTPRSVIRRRVGKRFSVCLLMVLALVLLSACGGNPQFQQQAAQSKQELDTSLAHAQQLGIPAAQLQPILQQEQQLAGTHSPLGLFADQPVNDYYTNLFQRYSQLNTQVTGMETQLTEQYDYQASQDLQTMSNILA